MNKLSAIAAWLFCITTTTAQVGIGTLTPNTKSVLELNSSSKGLLLPRMTATERGAMSLGAADAGMMVYQTTSPKGFYLFDGANWTGYSSHTLTSGTGPTLRWNDGSKSWESTTNLFNQGTSIGINTTNPKSQLHINTSSIPVCQLQITNPVTGQLTENGLIMGLLAYGAAQLNQQENHPLLFATNKIERVRIDSIGRVGINKTNPSSTLDVNGTLNVSGAVDLNGAVNANGTLKIGAAGSVLQSVIRGDVSIDPPSMAFMAEWTASVPFPGVTANATVYVSPGSAMDHMLIAYSMVSAPNFIDIKLMNMGPTIDMASVMVHVVVIQ